MIDIAWIQHKRAIYFFAVLASALLSLWIGYREEVINTDAICYLLSAQIIGETGIRGAMHLCGQAKWPFYSALIYGFVQISHLPYFIAAYLLNGFFSILSVTMFVLIVKELGGSQRMLWLAALTILLSHEFNSVREYIVRDHGFWAFYLTSFWFLLRYFQKPGMAMALGFSLSLCIATLFRIEGAVFLLLLPFLSFFCSRYAFGARLKSFFVLNLPLIFIGILLAGWLLTHPGQTLDQLGRVPEVYNQFAHALSRIIEYFQSVKTAFAQHVLPSDSAKDAGLVLFVALIAWYVISILSNLSWGYAFLAIYGWFTRSIRFARGGWLVFGGYLVINIMVTLGFFLQHLFLSKRYLIALSLILMLCVPFALDHLIKSRASLRSRLFLLFVALMMAISAVGGIFDFGYSKAYIRQAGDWLAQNVPGEANLYANDRSLMYYSNHYGYSLFEQADRQSDIDSIAHGNWKKYDYVALRLNKKEEGKTAALLQEIPFSPIHVFNNKRGDRVVIYRINS